jgi:hypothetical protein
MIFMFAAARHYGPVDTFWTQPRDNPTHPSKPRPGIRRRIILTMTNVSASFPSPLASLAMEVRRVAEMIEKLPAACYADGVAPLLQQAGVECFFVHVRSLDRLPRR